MFWRFGGYANISTIDSILDKPDFTLEEVLDESDLIQELKQHNSKLIEYLRDESVLQRLLAYVIAPPLYTPEEEFALGGGGGLSEDDDEDDEDEPEPPRKTFSPIRNLSGPREKPKTKEQEEREEREEAEKTRQKYAYVASEILASETWSIIESLIENQIFLRQFWEFIRKEPPLDPATAGYFTKINETLLDKKTEETLEFIKSLPGIVPAMLRHVDCPMILDLLLKIISMEKSEGGQGIVDWLQTQDLMPSLLGFLHDSHPTFTQTSAGDFIKAIITISANASQNEQSCIGPNSLTRQLVSEPCIEALITNMLKGGNPLTVGVGIIIEVIRKNNSDYDPEIQAGQEMAPATSDPIYLGTLLRLFAQHVPDFMDLILSPTHTVLQGDSTVTIKRKSLLVASGESIEPLGFDRFKTCELMAELLHCSNMGLLNEKGSEAYINQRDMEREQLRAEGALARQREPQSAVTEFSEDGSSFDTDAQEGSPTSSRHLEVTNNTDEDGFEDVGRSEDIPREGKDSTSVVDDGPKTPTASTRPPNARLSLDDEFVDEPLESDKSSARPDPLSPATAMASKVKQLHIDDEGSEDKDSGSSEHSSAEDLVHEIESQLQPSDVQESEKEKPVPSVEGQSSSPLTMSPNPNDTPAPLFAKADAEPSSVPHERIPEGEASQPEAGDAAEHHSEAAQQAEGASAQFIPHLENDIDGRPIVGDYLKRQFVDHRVVPTILDFFFRFPWNNFLHNVVYDVVQQVFNGPMDRGFNRHLAFDLFQSGRITERIIEGQLRSDEAQARKSTRLGYMGHLTLLAEEVVKFSERYPPEVLSDVVLDRVTDKVWTDYVEITLNETRERDNAILGGVKPDSAMGPRAAVLNAVNAAQGFGGNASSVLANAGLNGGGAGLDSMDLSNNPGFLGGGSLLSGFGSSSDEEDEDMEELGGERGIGVGSGGGEETGSDSRPHPLTALSIFAPQAAGNQASAAGTGVEAKQGSDQSGGSGLPVPPPLNIPPSRARRQLAARLAMHSKNVASQQQSQSLSPQQAQSPSHEAEKAESPTSDDGGAVGGASPTKASSGSHHTTSLDALLAAAARTPPDMAAEEALKHTDAHASADSDPWAKLDRAGQSQKVPALDPAWEPRGARNRDSGSADWVDFGESSSSNSSSSSSGEDGVGGHKQWTPPSKGDEASDGDGEADGNGVDVPLRMSASPQPMSAADISTSNAGVGLGAGVDASGSGASTGTGKRRADAKAAAALGRGGRTFAGRVGQLFVGSDSGTGTASGSEEEGSGSSGEEKTKAKAKSGSK